LSLNLRLLSLGLKLLKLLRIVAIGTLIPRVWHELIRAGIRNWMLPFWVVDLSIVSSISLQPTIEVVRTNIFGDPLY
jgi:hypothetical protein